MGGGLLEDYSVNLQGKEDEMDQISQNGPSWGYRVFGFFCCFVLFFENGFLRGNSFFFFFFLQLNFKEMYFQYKLHGLYGCYVTHIQTCI